MQGCNFLLSLIFFKDKFYKNKSLQGRNMFFPNTIDHSYQVKELTLEQLFQQVHLQKRKKNRLKKKIYKMISAKQAFSDKVHKA